MVGNAFNPRQVDLCEFEAWSAEKVPEHPRLPGETPSQREKNSHCYLAGIGNKSTHIFLHCRSQTPCEMSDSEDDDTPQLSSHTLAALQEFYAEQKQTMNRGGDDKYSVGVIEENWVSECIPVGKQRCGTYRTVVALTIA